MRRSTGPRGLEPGQGPDCSPQDRERLEVQALEPHLPESQALVSFHLCAANCGRPCTVKGSCACFNALDVRVQHNKWLVYFLPSELKPSDRPVSRFQSLVCACVVVLMFWGYVIYLPRKPYDMDQAQRVSGLTKQTCKTQ